MLPAFKIKEEPHDETENLQEIFRQEGLVKQQISAEFPYQSEQPFNTFNIVEEKDSIITVSAGEMKSEDELRFINSISNTDPNKFKEVCSKCLKIFTNSSQYYKHIYRNHCVAKQKCPVCPVTFIDAASLLKHLNLHRENIFFCSRHCGANYTTLLSCEEHELIEHKIQSTPKQNYKHFCSFCREGFKSELQLHVHWLQQTQGCGKLLQDVALYTSEVANSADTSLKNCKNPLLDKQIHSANTSSIPTIPITKLRLKYTSTNPETNKRQNGSNAEVPMKRLKTFDKIKTELASDQLPFTFEPEIKIKEEPLDDYEGSEIPEIIPEVIIKTEEEEEEIEEKPADAKEITEKPVTTSLLINNVIRPASTGKFIPLEEFVPSETTHIETTRPEMKTFSINNLMKTNDANAQIANINKHNLPVLKIINNNFDNITLNNAPIKTDGNLRLVKITPAPMPPTNKILGGLNFENIKNLSTGKFVSLKLPNGQTLTNSDISPLPKSGLQIIQILPNTQLTTVRPNKPNVLGNKAPLVINLKPPSTVMTTAPNLRVMSTTAPLVNTTLTTEICSPLNSNISTSAAPASTLSIPLNSIEQNTIIDAEDFNKLQNEALVKAEEHRKNFYIPKTRLMIIENIPERKQLIDSMKQQIAEVETKSTEQSQNQTQTQSQIQSQCQSKSIPKPVNKPVPLYLPVLTTIDDALVNARYKYPNYNYKWVCPYCRKEYEIKTPLKMHLSRAHNLNNRDMEKIYIQAKPYLNEEEPIKDVNCQIKEEPLTQDSDSQPLTATSETESLAADNTLSSPPNLGLTTHPKTKKIGYICYKCDRTCSSKTMLNDHILANCSREPQYSCKECDKKFFSHGTLQCHMTIHTGELPHKCNYCDKRFRTRGQVKVHHRTHTGERPFFCQVCSQRFTHRETLIAHLSRHIGMKRYKCYGCDKLFSCISALKTHREIRADTCGKVKFNPRAIGPRVRVIRGNVIFEPQPEINPYLKSEDPKNVLSELQNQSQSSQSSQSS